MSARRKTSDDRADPPTIREIRALRQRLLKQAGGSIEGYFQLMRDMAQARTAQTRAARPRRRRGKTA